MSCARFEDRLRRRRKRLSAVASAKAIALPFVIVLAIGIGGCAPGPQPAAEEVTVWRPLGKWSGSGLLQSDPFISNSGLLRVTWEARSAPTASIGSLRIVLHSDVSGRSLALVVEHQGAGRGVNYITEDPRSFFLVIESSGVEWSVDVAEGVTATRTKPL